MDKVLFITYFWPPSGKASLHWPLNIIQHLSKLNWHISVLTVKEDIFSHKDDFLLKTVPPDIEVIKTGSYEPFGIYKKLMGKDKTEALIPSESISEENKSPGHKFSVWVRMNLFVPDARAGWYWPAVKEGKNFLSGNKDYKAIISIGPPHTAHLIGKKLSKEFSITHIPVFIDPWTDIVYYKNFKRNKIVLALDKYFEKSVLENAGRVVFVTGTMKSDYEKKYNWLKNKTNLLYWGYNDEVFNEKTTGWFSGVKTIVHAGNIFDYQNPAKFFKNIKKKIDSGERIRLKFIGTVSPGIKKILEEIKLDENTEFSGFLPYPEMIQEIMKASYLLVCATEPRHVPGKLFEYLRAGKPIIAFGNNNEEVQKILEETNAGMLFSYDDDAESFFLNAGKFKTNPEIVKKYDRKNIAEKLAEIIRSIS